jgi:hypothetical protein
MAMGRKTMDKKIDWGGHHRTGGSSPQDWRGGLHGTEGRASQDPK